MIVAIEKSTGMLILSDSGSDVKTETINAINCGFTKEEIEVKEVTDEEFQIISENQPRLPHPPTSEERLQALEQALLEIVLGGA